MLRQDSGPPLFYLLEGPIVRAAERMGWPDAMARAIPFLAAAALFAGALRLPDAAARRWFLVLTATSPLLLIYAAEARAYALLALLVFALFLLAMKEEAASTRTRVAVALLTAAALYTHYLALFAVGALLFVTLLQRRMRAAAAVAAGCVLFLPWVPVLLRQPRAATDWIRDSPLDSAVGLLAALGGGARVTPALGGPLPRSLTLAGAATAVLLACFMRRAWRDRASRAALLLVASTLASVLVVSLWRPTAFAGRTELAVLPVWIWAVGRSAAQSRGARAAAVAAAAVGLLSSALILRAQSRAASPYDPAVAAVVRVAGSGDLLIAAGPFYLPARLAAERGRIVASVTAFPPDLAAHPGWLEPDAPSPRDYEKLRRAVADCSGDCRAFFIGFAQDRTRALESILAPRGAPRLVWRRGAVELMRWGQS